MSSSSTAPSALHRRWPELDLGYRRLGATPTRVEQVDLPGIAEGLWIKRDDEFGDGAWGGNKVRKLEWILPEAQRRGVRTLFTVGGIGTHWGLACARYGDEVGLRTVLGLVDQPVDDHVREQWARLVASPAVIHRFSASWRLRLAAPWLLARAADRRGLRFTPPWYLPAGGSNAVGTLGYVETALEIADQVAAGELPEPASVVVPIGSGGTAAGLTLGFKIAGLATRVLGVVVNDSFPLHAEVMARLANRTGELLRSRGARDVPSVTASDLTTRDDWLGSTYGDPTPASMAAVRAAATVGLELEPVYTGKALAAVAELGGALPGPVLWLHTHGPR
ncbi:1-aminocyclopropane-1-carboxylate deaminase/D-cysteine desulfhydrase [Nocardioides sp. Bht2]|uniref:1-aminocyclopropane-1-carboxylate deaminase/D-cysteine desulfhydrase n=1 Tax=Nocardioides sp. Bht2 TaxID=3392297 RepID=UPI0039B4E214